MGRDSGGPLCPLGAPSGSLLAIGGAGTIFGFVGKSAGNGACVRKGSGGLVEPPLTNAFGACGVVLSLPLADPYGVAAGKLTAPPGAPVPASTAALLPPRIPASSAAFAMAAFCAEEVGRPRGAMVSGASEERGSDVLGARSGGLRSSLELGANETTTA